MNDDPIRLTTRATNNRLKTIRESKGLTQKEMALLCGIDVGKYGGLENLKRFPDPKTAVRIAENLGEPVEYIFPEYLKGVSTTVSVSTVAELDILSLADPNLRALPVETEESLTDVALLKRTLQKCTHTLTEHEEKVLTLRFGLDGNGERTLDEIGAILSRSKERVRQILAKGLRKMRHPTLTRQLKGFLEK